MEPTEKFPLLIYAGFPLVFFFLSVVKFPVPSLESSPGIFSLKARTKYCFWQRIHRKKERGRKGSICPSHLHCSSLRSYHNDCFSAYGCSLHLSTLRSVLLWENPLFPLISWIAMFSALISVSPNVLAFLLPHIPQNSFHIDVTFSCFPWWFWFHSFYIYFWISNTFLWLKMWYRREHRRVLLLPLPLSPPLSTSVVSFWDISQKYFYMHLSKYIDILFHTFWNRIVYDYTVMSLWFFHLTIRSWGLFHVSKVLCSLIFLQLHNILMYQRPTIMFLISPVLINI